MLFGLGIDGIIVLYLRYLEEQRRGSNEAQTTRGMAKTGASVALAQATSVATFLALLVLDFPTLQGEVHRPTPLEPEDRGLGPRRALVRGLPVRAGRGVSRVTTS